MNNEIELGDIVSTLAGFKTALGDFGLEGIVCCIDGDCIWFFKGDCPKKLAMSGNLKNSARNFKYKDKTYTWKIMCRNKNDLIKKPLYFIETKIFKKHD